VSSGQTEYGALKLTFQKFYRISGGSNQLKGVIPDVVLPDTYEYLKFREKDNPTALGWDQIASANYQPSNSVENMQEIQKKADERLKNNTAFNLIKNNSLWLSKKNDKDYDLNIDAYKKEQNLIKSTVKQDETISKLRLPMSMQPAEVDKDKFYNNADKAKGDRYQQWLKNIQGDIYINETVNIVKDILASQTANTVKH
ncbi:MAG TPA: carboxy terminal-processing peptidase, partial [Panacibacter sp.]|nr:carboxy terminal-processing peptidase [Panacibacter sp.]